MKIAVRYYTKNGHTKKLAAAVADVANVQEKDIWEPLEEYTDILFLGSSVYVAGVNKSVREFIAYNKDKIGTIYSFGSAAILESTYKYVQKVCEEHGVKLAAEEFHCRGEFMGRHVGHPDNVDIANIKLFAQRVLDSNK